MCCAGCGTLCQGVGTDWSSPSWVAQADPQCQVLAAVQACHLGTGLGQLWPEGQVQSAMWPSSKWLLQVAARSGKGSRQDAHCHGAGGLALHHQPCTCLFLMCELFSTAGAPVADSGRVSVCGATMAACEGPGAQQQQRCWSAWWGGCMNPGTCSKATPCTW